MILHADVVGSTTLVQRDESLAHQRITGAFASFADRIAAYRGIVHEVRGDALVAEFARASDAVTAALAFQADNAARNAALDDGVAPQVRVGVSIGEVVIADGTVTGAGVVLAQRVEQLAPPGGICITGAVHEAVPGRLPFDYADLGPRSFKGFTASVHVRSVTLRPGAEVPPPETGSRSRGPLRGSRFVAGATAIALLAAAGAVTWWKPWTAETGQRRGERASASSEDRPSVAVLPFVNISGDADQEYFSDGITEDLITDLYKVHGLRVISGNSTFRYKGQSPDPRQVGEELGVRYVLEGSVRRAEGRIRITAQFVDTGTGYQVWAERYDRELNAVFAVQDEVARKIVAALSITLSGEEKARLERPDTSNIEAYDLFLRGQQFFKRLTKEDNLRAQEMYEHAFELDPSFARAYGALAVSYAMDVRRGWTAQPDERLDRAAALARKAVALDESSPHGQWAIGYVHLFKREYQAAIEALERAVRIAPNYADGYALLALINNNLGRPDEAVRLIERAMLLNPYYSFEYPYNLGRAYYTAGRYGEAVDALQEAIERNHASLFPRLFLAASYVRLGRQADAEWEIQEIQLLEPSYRVSQFAQTSGMADRGQLNSFLDDLRKAGLSE